MANSIRTPRVGTTSASRRIAEAVDNEEWQQFRLSLKGLSTEDKLSRLDRYWNSECASYVTFDVHDIGDCSICIRVDNYIKALCRGGQLYAGETLYTMVEADWKPKIKK